MTILTMAHKANAPTIATHSHFEDIYMPPLARMQMRKRVCNMEERSVSL